VPDLRPIGVLALQGDFEKHRQAFAAAGRETVPVRRPAELDPVAGLVIPGGESTTLSRLIDRIGLRQPLLDFAATRPVMGTCAGLILLGRELAGEAREDWHGVRPLGLLDVAVVRNAYGRQIDSFTEPLSLVELDGAQDPFSAVYIRAPRIAEVGPGARPVARRRDGEVVGVRQGSALGLAFHPELTADSRIHRAFLEMCDGRGAVAG
jgi:5'-phosphate synthase pdxT subunit